MCFTVQLSRFSVFLLSSNSDILSCCFLFVKNFFNFFQSFFVLFCSSFWQLNYSITAFHVCQHVFNFFSSCLQQNGEGGIWTLAPLLTTYSLSRGAPSAAWVLLQNAWNHFYIYCRHTQQAERMGFEPMRPFGQTVFKTASLWPLRYLSKLFMPNSVSVCAVKFPQTFYWIAQVIYYHH